MKFFKMLKETIIYFRFSKHLHTFYHKFFTTSQKVIKKEFEKRLNRKPELNNPILFTDKLQWLKLNWYDQRAVKMADKYEARNLVSEIIGKNYLNKLISVYNSVNEIDISELPNSFVLKGTHGSGFNIVCRDKKEFNWKKEKRK